MTHSRPTLVVLLAVLAVSATACGPDIPIEVGIRDYSTDIVYGAQRQPTALPPPVPAANPSPGFPGFIVPPPPASAVTSLPPPPLPTLPPAVVACPVDDPFDFPAEPATRTIVASPTAGVYTFRQGGTFVVGDQPPRPLPAESLRQIRDVVADPESGDLTYDVVIESLGDTTTSSYAVRQTTGDPSLDGVFLTRVVTRRADGSADEFTPVSGARIIALPAGPSVSWNDAAIDPLRGSSLVVQGTVVDKGRVNACGTVLDAWTVEVTGRLLGPDKDLLVTATYQVGTQFGGFVLADQVTITGTDGGVQVELQSTATVNAIDPAPLSVEEGGTS